MVVKKDLIVLSAGGTGGHMFPAVALAQDLKSRGFDVQIVTDTRAAHYQNYIPEVIFHILPSGTLRAGLIAKIKDLTALSLGIVKAFLLLRSLKPCVVVGFGGYPSFPAVYAAQKMSIPTLLHEQNGQMGKANQMLAEKARAIALSLPLLKNIPDRFQSKTTITGNPVRPAIVSLFSQPYPPLIQDGKIHLLILGGSLGARIFSLIVPEAISRLRIEDRLRLDVVQQVRLEDLPDTQAFYEKLSVKARLQHFFEDIPSELAACHLLIGRSGASTVAEVTTAGRPAIFVPYPHHTDQQQKVNADVVSDAGGAWVMTEDGFTPEALANRLEVLLQNPETLFRAAEKARSCGRPDAARKLGNLVMSIAKNWQIQDE